MLTHDDILTALQESWPANTSAAAPAGVFLVARLLDSDLGTSDPTPHVFIPDIHLVPRVDAARFPWATAGAAQVAGLTQLGDVLLDLRREDPNLRVWQLGDFIDLWRTGKLGGDSKADADATVADRREIVELLCARLGMDVLVGNHDQELLSYAWPGARPALKTVILDRKSGTADTVLAHGHQFDPIETLPRDVKENFARGFTELVPPAALGMLEATNPHWKPQAVSAPPPPKPGDPLRFLHYGLAANDPLPLESPEVNVIEHQIPALDPSRAFIDSLGGGMKPSVDGPRQTFCTDAAWWAEYLSLDSRDVRLMVIGHTHQARIVRGSRTDGTPFVLMDCGAWVGSNFLSDQLGAPILNSQIGVKVGDDLRIYQLGYTART
jgi:UDP-2,3-diacylglucosamine pyrophosphatase LpxH